MRHVVAADLRRCVETLVDAYADDPFYRWLFPIEDGYRQALTDWFAMVSGNHFKFGHYYRSEDFSVVTDWVPPDVPLNTADGWNDGRALVASWTDKDHAAKAYDAIATRNRSRPEGSSWQLIYLAVAADVRRQGHGELAIRPMLDMCDEQEFGIFYNSSNPDNVPLLEGVGFRALDAIRVDDTLTFQPLYREPGTNADAKRAKAHA